MSAAERRRTRVLADRYIDKTGESVYGGVDQGGTHYFADGYVRGDGIALAHMIELCRQADVPTD